ncbi:MAG: methyltransferase domain-containing protein [Thermodesulfovibrionales bacterium]
MKLLILSINDILVDENIRLVRDLIKNDYSILAIDSRIIVFCLQNNLTYHTIDQFFAPFEIRQISQYAHYIEWKWFDKKKDLFYVDDICWPAFDHHAMFWFWRDVLLAEEFSKRFYENGGEDIYVFPNVNRLPYIYYDSNMVWKECFTNPQYRLNLRQRSILNILKKNFTRDSEKATFFSRINVKYSLPYKRELITLAFNVYELYRFYPLIKDIISFMGRDRIRLYSIHDSPRIVSEANKQLGIEINTFKQFDFYNIEISKHFLQSFKSLKEDSEDWLRDIFDCYHFHFKHYFEKRLPCLVFMFNRWQHLLMYESPKLVITSQLMDAESQLPVIAGKRLGIETWSVPHGFFSVDNPVQLADKLFVCSKLSTISMVKNGIPENIILLAKGMIPYQEYPMSNPFEFRQGDKINILVLLTCTTLNNVLMPYFDINRQVEALKFLKNISERYSSKINLKYKVHPGWPDVETLYVAGIKDENILPIDSDPVVAIKQSDIVVDINYSSISAISQSIEFNKPLIFFLNTPVNITHCEYEFIKSAGTVVDNEKAFEILIKKIIHEDKKLEEMTSISRLFFESHLKTDYSKSFVEYLEMFFNRKALEKCDVLQKNLKIINIDADIQEYYGEVTQTDFKRILKRAEQIDNIELATNEFCRVNNNHYFRSYALDPRRALSIGLFANVEGKKVLDYGCGIGSLGFVYAKNKAEVLFVDKCLDRLQFAKLRCEQAKLNNNSFWGCKDWHSLPFQNRSLDIICINGVLEWVADMPGISYKDVKKLHIDFLKKMSNLIKKSGHIYLAIENRFALRYFLGYPEDHTEIPFISLMDRDKANQLHLKYKGEDFKRWTWGYDEFKELLQNAGLCVREAYAVFPDYRFPEVIVPLTEHNLLSKHIKQDLIRGALYNQDVDNLVRYLEIMGLTHYIVYSYAFLIVPRA